MKKVITVVLAVTTFMAGTAFADTGLDLAKQKQCLTCHSVDKALIGPSFRDIAKKYKNRHEFDGALITQVIGDGPASGSFHWGTTKMPNGGARPAVSVSEANQLLDWILSQK